MLYDVNVGQTENNEDGKSVNAMSKKPVNVYVFGAGASHHVHGPLLCDFLCRGFGSTIFAPDGVPLELALKIADLIDAIYHSDLGEKLPASFESKRSDFSPSAFAHVTIEDLLTFVDVAIEKRETWLPFEEFRLALIDFTFETLEYCIRPAYSDSYTSAPDGTLSHHRNRYDELIDYVIPIDEENCFISFNYDLCLDTAVSINNHGILGDYNLPFETVSHFDGYDRFLHKRREQRDVDILKLHGSMNWTRCVTCKAFALSFHSSYRDHKNSVCKRCSNRVEPVLVPPTHRKRMEEWGVGPVWERAERQLHAATALTIVGYSFPAADVEARWLFSKALARNHNRPTLTVVDPNDGVRKRIFSTFEGTIGDRQVYDTFEQYCDAKKANN